MNDIILDTDTLSIRHIEPVMDGDIEVTGMISIVLGGVMLKELPREIIEIPQNMKVRIIIQKEGLIK